MSQKTLVCHECDLLVALPDTLAKDQKLACPRCHHTITRGHKMPKQRVFAVAFSCLLLLFMANFFPFLTFQSQGRSQTISLLQTSSEMYLQDYRLMGVLIFLFIFCLPLFYILSLLGFALLTKVKALPTLALELGKLISSLTPWCMADVFFTGAVVALIKIIEMAEIVFGIAFYSYLLFALLFIYLTAVMDLHRLWHWYSEAYESD